MADFYPLTSQTNGLKKLQAATQALLGQTYRSEVADGASAVGFTFDTSTTYSNAAAKIAAWTNNTVEVMSIKPTGLLSVIGTTGSGFSLKNTGDNDPSILIDANRSAANSGLGDLRGLWNSNLVARFALMAGADTTNKDEGWASILTRGVNDASPAHRLRVEQEGWVGLGATAASARLHMLGNTSSAAWTTAGIGFRSQAATWTDTSSSGTVAAMSVHAIAQPTVAASSTTTYTRAATWVIDNAVTNGANVTLTNAHALWVKAGSSYFQGDVESTSSLIFATSVKSGTDPFLSNPGTANVFVGVGAGANRTSGGDYNFIGGFNAGFALTSGAQNVFIGRQAGMSVTTASLNTFVGESAGRLTTGGSSTFVGQTAGDGVTSGAGNTLVGNNSGKSIAQAFQNTIMGSGCGAGVRSDNGAGGASQNVFIGHNACTGTIGIGGGSYNGSSDGSFNVVVGQGTANSLTNGFFNCIYGQGNATSLTTGSYNTFLGRGGGATVTTGSHNTCLGYGGDLGSATRAYAILIGDSVTSTADNQLVVGSAATSANLTEGYFGSGVEKAAPTVFAFRGTNVIAGTTDTASAELGIYAGRSTGTGAGGSIVFKVSPAAASTASTQNALVQRFVVGQYATFNDGGHRIKRTNTATDYTVLVTDYYVTVSSTAAARTLTLPSASSVGDGAKFIVKDTSGGAGTNSITITRAGSDTIDGANTAVINSNYGSLTLISDGSASWGLN